MRVRRVRARLLSSALLVGITASLVSIGTTAVASNPCEGVLSSYRNEGRYYRDQAKSDMKQDVNQFDAAAAGAATKDDVTSAYNTARAAIYNHYRDGASSIAGARDGALSQFQPPNPCAKTKNKKEKEKAEKDFYHTLQKQESKAEENDISSLKQHYQQALRACC